MPRLIVLTGFLGAGKTTTMLAAGRLLGQHGHRVAVITNDHGTDLVDTQLAEAVVPDVGEVTGGCFCCRFDELADLVTDLLDGGRADTILAEAVGSCTDLQATVIRPLLARYGDRLAVAPLTTVVDPARFDALSGDLGYLFDRQLAEADVIAVNKADTLPRARLDALLDRIRARHPAAGVLAYSASSGENIDQLVTRWTGVRRHGPDVDLDVDYDRYAAAEARLGWLNQAWQVSAAGKFPARRWAHVALDSFSAACARQGHVIGHAKLVVQSPAGLIRMSVVTAGEPPHHEPAGTEDPPVADATVLVNVRAACSPRTLESLLHSAALDADRAAGAAARPGPVRAFAPSYPRPVHRLPAARVTTSGADHG